MKAPRLYSTEEIVGLPSETWVLAELHSETIRELQREMSLMFPPQDHLDLVRERDQAQTRLLLYETALTAIAAATGQTVHGNPQSIELLTRTVVERLLQARALERREKTASER